MFKKRSYKSTVSRTATCAFRKPTDDSWTSWLSFVGTEYRRQRICSMFTSREGDPRPYLTVEIYGLTFVGLLDSGASRTVIGSSGWSKLQSLNVELKLEKNVCAVTVANGSSCEVLGVLQLPIKLDNKVRLIKALVVLGISDNIIFGVDFWRDMNIIPSLANNSYTVGESTQIYSMVNQETLTAEQALELEKLTTNFFNRQVKTLGCAKNVCHTIDTGDATPIKQRYYPVSPYMQKIINDEVDNMLKLGVIEPSNSPWSSPVVVVKKSNGEYRFCVDFRKVNQVTKRDAYPLPYINMILDRLRGATVLSSIDLKSAYWQVPLDDASKEKTAFTVPGRGLFHFNRMPFGLQNAPACFQRLVDNLGADLEPFVFVYLDDIIVATPDFSTHLEVLGKIFERLLDAGLTVNKEKCEFVKNQLRYLGYIVDRYGLRPDPGKIESMVNYPTPRTAKEVRRFIGLISWYRRFVENFATRISPLTRLTRKNQTFIWDDAAEKAFLDIKQCLISAPILTCPDFSRPFTIQTDASLVGLGCVLTQEFPEGEKVIAYASRSLTAQESKYSTTELECLSLIYGVEKFRPYIEGVHFTVITDHYSLKWLHNLKNPSGRLVRWALRLQGYDFTVVHRKGTMHAVPDALSRAVCFIDVTEGDYDNWYSKLFQNIRDKPRQYPKFKIVNNKIYKLVISGYQQYQSEYDWKIVIPKKLRCAVLLENHNDAAAGHLGFFKTLKRIAATYYWPRMSIDVARYVRDCEVCKSQKPEQKVSHGVMTPRTIDYPWQCICTDLIGPLPMSKKRNRFVLVVHDTFTKYSLLFPLKTANSTSITKHIEQDVFLIYGVPQRIICDNGRQYVSKEFSKMVKSYDCEFVYNAAYHPQANPCERVNKTLKTMIRSYIKENQREWDENLPKLGFALRTAVHEITGYSPAYLNFGRDPFISGKMYRDFQNIQANAPLQFSERRNLAEHVKILRDICVKVRDRMQKSYQQSSARYNLRHRPMSLEVGQIVWKKNYTLSDAANYYSSKLGPKFIKCRVRRKISTNVYELESVDNKQSIGSWHIKDLKID